MGKLFRSALLAMSPLLVWAALCSSCAQAQDAPRLEFTGNYSYLHFDSFDLGFKKDTGLNGGNVGVAYNITTHFAAIAEVGGNWGSPFKFYDGMGGGRYTYRRGNIALFGQGLFGRAKSRISLPTSIVGSETNSNYAFGGGGGVSYDLTPHFAIRAIQVDYLHSNLFATSLNSVRFSAGITYHIGRVRQKRRPRLTR
ncbi:MAG TPA: outer membrane beta-barrel protein [Terriglobales bacterium]|jgi:opacity protein-like surface antigen